MENFHLIIFEDLTKKVAHVTEKMKSVKSENETLKGEVLALKEAHAKEIEALKKQLETQGNSWCVEYLNYSNSEHYPKTSFCRSESTKNFF